MILSTMIIVLIAPVKIMNPLCDVFVKEDAIIAACDAPKPGKNPDIVDAKNAQPVDFIIVDFFILSVSVVCLGMVVLSFNERISMLVPKSPDKSGNRGWSKFKFSTIIPKVPAKRNVVSALSLLFAFKIKVKVAAIKMYGM